MQTIANKTETYKVPLVLAVHLPTHFILQFFKVSKDRKLQKTNAIPLGFEHRHDCKSNFTSQVAKPSEGRARNGNDIDNNACVKFSVKYTEKNLAKKINVNNTNGVKKLETTAVTKFSCFSM